MDHGAEARRCGASLSDATVRGSYTARFLHARPVHGGLRNADGTALKQLPREDAMLEATLIKTWFAGIEIGVPFLAKQVFGAPVGPGLSDSLPR
jgi:hypothetical protein